MSICTSPKSGMSIIVLWQRKYNSAVSVMFLSSPQAKHSKLTTEFDGVTLFNQTDNEGFSHS